MAADSFISAFNSGMFYYCQLEFGCDITTLEEQKNSDGYRMKIAQTILQTTQELTSGLCPIQGVAHNDEIDLSEEIDTFNKTIPIYDSTDLYRNIRKRYPDIFVNKILKTCSLTALLQHIDIHTSRARELFLITYSLWDSHIRKITKPRRF